MVKYPMKFFKIIFVSLFIIIGNYMSAQSPKFDMEGYLDGTPIRAITDFKAKPGPFEGKVFYLNDIEEFGFQPEMANIIKGRMDENGNVVFDEYFYGSVSPFARFKGVWGDSSDGEGIHGDLTTLSVGISEDFHLYFIE